MEVCNMIGYKGKERNSKILFKVAESKSLDCGNLERYLDKNGSVDISLGKTQGIERDI